MTDLTPNALVILGKNGIKLIPIATDINGRISADFGLYEQATFDMDTYANGADNRISYSASMSLLLLKYWINVQNGLIVIRHISVQGSASLGTYQITLTGTDVIAAATGVNIISTDTKIYRKTISNSEFDYLETNCSIEGFIIDYLLNPNDVSVGYAVVTGGGSAPNAYDDNLLSYAGTYTSIQVDEVQWEISFTSIDINELHYHLWMEVYEKVAAAGWTSRIFFEINQGGSWQTLETLAKSSGTLAQTYYVHDLSFREDVTGFRIRTLLNPSEEGAYGKSRFYDLSVFT